MSKPQIILFQGMAEQLADALEAAFTVHKVVGSADIVALPAQTKSEIKAVAMSGADQLDNKALEALTRLEIVSCYGVGYDGIDASRLAERGVMVTHTPGVLDDEVANTAIALTLAITRRIVSQDKYVRDGRWAREGAAPLTRGLRGKAIGVVGMGRIGQAIAGKLALFTDTIGYHARSKRDDVSLKYFDRLPDLAQWADILVVITPGGSGTRHLINGAILDKLGPTGTLINVSRGSVVDEKALIKALEEGRLGAAGLDVFEDEPNVPQALIERDNVVLLPHIGSATVETRKAMADLTVQNLVVWFRDGKPITPVPECQ